MKKKLNLKLKLKTTKLDRIANDYYKTKKQIFKKMWYDLLNKE